MLRSTKIIALKTVSVMYCFFLAYITFFSDWRQEQKNYRELANFKLLKRLTHKLFNFNVMHRNGQVEILQEIFGNILMFVPLPFMIFVLISQDLTKWQCALLIFITTLFIEIIQFVFNIGVFDVDDIFLNFTGGVIGICLFNFLYKEKAT